MRLKDINQNQHRLINAFGYKVIYFLCCEGENLPVKVGAASDVHNRIMAHQGSNWRDLEILELFYVKHIRSAATALDFVTGKIDEKQAVTDQRLIHGLSALKAERFLHSKFGKLGHKRVREWWFIPKDQIVNMAKQLLVKEFPLAQFHDYAGMQEYLQEACEQVFEAKISGDLVDTDLSTIILELKT